MQAVTGVDLEALAMGIHGRLADAGQLGGLLSLGGRIGIAAGVQLDVGSTTGHRRVDLGMVGIDKQGDLGTDRRQAGHGSLHDGQLTGHVQATLGGDLLTLLRHQADEVRLDLTGDVQHLRGHRHLQVHAGLQGFFQHPHISVLDVPAVFTQVDA